MRFVGNRSKTAPLADDEDFVRLFQVADEDPQVRRMLVSVLSLAPFHRHSALSTWIDQLKLKGAPPPLIHSISRLTDPAVAEKALALLCQDPLP